MSLSRLRRFGAVLLFSLLALAASTVAQNQLSNNVLLAALEGETIVPGAGHYMPDGTFMAGPMADMGHAAHHTIPAQNGGHTHKGHADCSLCGAVAAMGSLVVPVFEAVLVPESFDRPRSWPAAYSVIAERVYEPYLSRAPPHLIG